MNLHGWRQLIEWSIKHASLDSSESKQLETVWEPLWNNFVSWILQRFGSIQQINKRSVKPSGARKKGESDKDWQERVRLETQDYEKDEAQFQYQVKEWRDLASLP